MKAESNYVHIIESPRTQSWAAVIVSIAVLVARKPWALTNPQLWAEDGTVHLNLVDQWGVRALFIPDRGYLNLIPRLIAWLAKIATDVAWWPAIYNYAALGMTALVFARLASRRLELPGKPWLILSFVLVPGGGEVFLNIANVHWLTGFFFVLQALITRPKTTAQRVGDLTAVVLAGLTDPSAIIFLPLLAWRWWRDRHADNLTVLLAAGACATTQAYFLQTTGPHFAAQSAPLHLLELLQRTGSRLIIGPVLGPQVVALLTPIAQALIAWAAIMLLVVWAVRPHERRPLRLAVLAAWALISIACIYRIRPDTWDVELSDLGFAEPYFYMSRLLLVWLLVWEFDSEPRTAGTAARAICIVGVLLSVPRYRVPAPPDYRWSEHCDPIRRGVPANIPTLPEGWTLEYPGSPRSN